MLAKRIQKNLDDIYESIHSAAQKSGRKPSDITMVAVTKNRSVEEIGALMRCGVHVLGENRVQEWREKYPAIKEFGEAHWNFIGQLQTNKIKYIINNIDIIQSVDRLELAIAINKYAQRNGKAQKILIEVNAARESSKAGVFLEDLERLAEQAAELEYVQLCGLMTVAPFSQDEIALRGVFDKMYRAYEKLREKGLGEIKYLSMGMSNDYKIAIEQGSNMVRIGRSIFDGMGA